MPSRIRALPLLVLLLLALVATGPPASADSVRHVPPVPGRVVRPFQPPATAFGPGHRGVDLAATAGDRVRASDGGTVRFAGQVAGAVWVTLEHAGGLLTSYGPLRDLEVAAGGRVGRGAPLGRLEGRPHPDGPSALHWSARLDGRYLDPLSLLAPPGTAWTATLVGPGEWWVSARPPAVGYAPWDGRHRLGLVPGSPRAEASGWVTAPNANHVIGIAGLATRSGAPPLDLTHLGYDPRDVTQFSYDPDGRYGAEDTWHEVDVAARRLRDQLRARWAAEPGRAVDLVGHSLGGVVALHYLVTYHDPLDPTLPPIGHVATLASPLGGADLARGVVDGREGTKGRLITDAVSAVVPGLDAGAPVVADLAVGSELLAGLAERWEQARAAPFVGPLATGTRVLTLGADADLVVPVHRSDLPGAPHAVLPGTHESVRRTEAARWVLRAFLTDAPIPAEDGGIAHALSFVIGWSERALAHAVLE